MVSFRGVNRNHSSNSVVALVQVLKIGWCLFYLERELKHPSWSNPGRTRNTIGISAVEQVVFLSIENNLSWLQSFDDV